MDVKNAIQSRRSIRNFQDKELATKDVNTILEAARLAPSGTNLQPWRFVVIESEEMRNELQECTLDFVAEAPVTIACAVDYNALEKVPKRIKELARAGAFKGTALEKNDDSDYSGRDMSAEEAKRYLYLNEAIAIENMALQATELGIGSCWVMMFNEDKLADRLDLDDNLELVSLLALGYPEEIPEQRPRLSLDEIVINRV
ncbi:nitroreductase family protein [Halanaerobacter jeridensis]|uniref:Nitroreductase n=1 Tax=Halanaerobacter jeridensis TaxID=706427 RepID=A0A938XV21_9FIRM|nr:nitroreductase family protein [Halanaerobacter jeridensis]MBM7555765.1 nitroreductase [Halanaerobacter jeridensis]